MNMQVMNNDLLPGKTIKSICILLLKLGITRANISIKLMEICVLTNNPVPQLKQDHFKSGLLVGIKVNFLHKKGGIPLKNRKKGSYRVMHHPELSVIHINIKADLI